jgi:deoxyribose-phosphate aldolase
LEYGFAAVCVPPPFVAMARQAGVRTATVIGFPFGYSGGAAKLAEVEQAIADGADELDVVINLAFVKSANWVDAGGGDEMADGARAHAAGEADQSHHRERGIDRGRDYPVL